MWWAFFGGLGAGAISGFAFGAIFGIWLTGSDEPKPRNTDAEYRVKSGGYGLEL